MLSRRDTTLLLFALGFAAFFIGIWFLPALPGVSYKKLFPWLILIWTVGSIITLQGCLVCLLSRVELRTALPVIAVHSALVFVDAILVFCYFAFGRYILNYSSLHPTNSILAVVGLSLALLYSLAWLSRLPFYRSCASEWHLWKYFIVFGYSLGSAIFFGIMSFGLPFAIADMS